MQKGFIVPIIVVAAFTLAIILLATNAQQTHDEQYNTLFSDQARMSANMSTILNAASTECDWVTGGASASTCVDSFATTVLGQIQTPTDLLRCTVALSTAIEQSDGNWIVRVPFNCQAQIMSGKTNVSLAYTKNIIVRKRVE